MVNQDPQSTFEEELLSDDDLFQLVAAWHATMLQAAGASALIKRRDDAKQKVKDSMNLDHLPHRFRIETTDKRDGRSYVFEIQPPGEPSSRNFVVQPQHRLKLLTDGASSEAEE